MDLPTAGHTFSVPGGKPLSPGHIGFWSWETRAAVRNIRLRRLVDEGAPR